MNSPKEKAIQLVNRFTKLEIEIGGQFDGYLTMNVYDAKQCALIAVDEIIKVAPIDKYENLDSQFSVEYVGQHLFEEYWEEVKTEIENL